MFTGIVEGLVCLKTREPLVNSDESTGLRFVFEFTQSFIFNHSLSGSLAGASISSMSNMPMAIGESVSINGVCLTLVEIDLKNYLFTVELVPETLKLTNLKNLRVGALANFEKAVSVHMRMGGHFVQGHVDGVLEIINLKSDGGAVNITLRYPEKFSPYFIPKGFISLDGMSLTIAGVDPDALTFWVTLIPHTRAVTIAQNYQCGSIVNFEIDFITKQIHQSVEHYLKNKK